jgi:hypothetical protein
LPGACMTSASYSITPLRGAGALEILLSCRLLAACLPLACHLLATCLPLAMQFIAHKCSAVHVLPPIPALALRFFVFQRTPCSGKLPCVCAANHPLLTRPQESLGASVAMASDGDVLRFLAGGEWARQLKWPSRGPPTTSWNGVREVENDRVTKLWLYGEGLTGEAGWSGTLFPWSFGGPRVCGWYDSRPCLHRCRAPDVSGGDRVAAL